MSSLFSLRTYLDLENENFSCAATVCNSEHLTRRPYLEYFEHSPRFMTLSVSTAPGKDGKRSKIPENKDKRIWPAATPWTFVIIHNSQSLVICLYWILNYTGSRYIYI